MERKFLVVGWKDGWKEVTEVEPDSIGLRRYFVIERVEYNGRVVVERPEGEVPDLVVIDRLPFDVQNMALFGTGEGAVLSKGSLYEEGDRVEHNYELAGQNGEFLTRLAGDVKEAIARREQTVEDVLKADEAQKREVLVDVATELRLVGSKSQEDVLAFMTGLLAGDR